MPVLLRRSRPAEGKASELFAKAALVLEDAAGNRLVILTADLIAMPREIADWISEQCAGRFGLRREQLLLATSHTHSGPEVRPSKVLFFDIAEEYAKKIPAFVEQLQEKMVAVIGVALDALAPARVYAAKGQARFAHNRRGAEKYFDHDVPVLRVTDLNGHVRAILFGYACHNTTLWEDSYVYCGDYAGFAQQYLQENFPEATALFLCGAAADQNPESREGTQVTPSRMAAELAEAVDCHAMDGAVEIAPVLRTAYEEVLLDFQSIPSREELVEQTKSPDKPVGLARRSFFWIIRTILAPAISCPLQMIGLGKKVMIIAMSGEPWWWNMP